MPKLTAHPSREELSAYSLGQLPEERAVALDTHISQCEPCCETIVELSSEDTFAGLLREAGRFPTDLTLDSDSSTAKSSSTSEDMPAPLAEHPRYEIIRLIGKGGMGDVYEARHRMMERTVALKVIKQELMRKPEAVDRFHREVKAAAQLAHPNVVTAYDAEQAGDIHFMVMEFVDGVDLSQMVKDRGALPVADACAYIRQAAIGLQHAHERGMVHRDIKPHNLMVTSDGTVKILDFGLASLAPKAIADADTVEARGDLTAAGAIMGTPDFISPEQADDARKADIRSDIYSLGATLYYLLSGQVPFDDGSVMHKLRSHAQVEPAPLNSVRDDVPEELVAIASKMMAKDPDERYLTPKEVADALESFLRTWQPGEANSQGQLLADAGDNVVSVVKDSSAGDAGRNWLLVVAAVLIIGCLAAGLYYTNGNIGGIRVEVTAPEDIGSLGTHPLTIVDTSGKKPLGGTSSTHQDDASGITTHSFKSANARYSITLVDKVLTVNGEKYTLENPTDAIRIVDDRVEITQVTSLPSKPELKITGKTVNRGTAGLPSLYDWNLKGRDVGDLTVRLLLAQNGKTEVMQEFDFEELPTEFANKVRLEVRDNATGVDRKRRVNAILFVGGPVPSASTSLNEDKGLSIDVEAPFSNKMERADLAPIAPGQTELLLALSYWKGDMTHDHSMESMTAATKDGNVTFLFVTLDWSPASPDVTAAAGDPGTSPNGKPVSECAAIQVALRKHYMDKYPLFAAWVNQNSNILSDPSKLREREWMRQINELGTNSPVSEVINSFPRKPYVTFTEVTQATRNEVLVVCVNLYRNVDGTCRAEVTKKQRKKRADEPVAVGKPITEEEVRKLVRRVVKDSDFKQLQGDWDVIAFTQDGKKEFAADQGVGMLVQIKGDTITRIQTAPNGEKSEKEWGRIELNSRTNPKSIDIVNPDGPGGRLLGIYELKDGALKICFAERSNVDDAQRRPVKRPTTFDAPTGSNFVLLECRRVTDNELKPVSQLMRQANEPGPGIQVAINELLRLEGEGLLDSDQVNDLIDFILKYQTDRERPWRTEMGDLIEKRWVAGTLDRELWEQYTAQLLVNTYRLRVRPRIVIGSGKMAVQQIRQDPRCGSGTHMTYQLVENYRTTKIGSTVVERLGDFPASTDLRHDIGGMNSTNFYLGDEEQWATIKPGKHKITREFELSILRGCGPEGAKQADVFASRKVEFETETTFLPPGQSTVNTNTDPAIKAAVEDALSIFRIETGPKPAPTTPDKFYAKVILNVNSRPIDVAFTFILKDGENEYEAGSMTMSAAETPSFNSMASIPVDLSGKRIDVILRPAPDEAEKSVDCFEIWGEEIVFRDVLVK